MKITSALSLVLALAASSQLCASAQGATGGGVSAVTPVRPLSAADKARLDAASARRAKEAATGEPDVLLDVPNLSVDKIDLEVQNLRVRLSLDAKLANLLSLNAGADASIDKVKLTIAGVRAEALLKVRLDNVAAIIDRTLTTVDRNPEILNRLLQSVDNTVGTVGNVANTALQPNGVLSQTVNTLGQTVNRTVDAAGNIVENTLDAGGKVLNSNSIGSVTGLPVVNRVTNAAGQTVVDARDAGGGLIRYTLDTAGKVLNATVLGGRR